MAFNPDAITPCILASATHHDDLDDAVRDIQDACGIEAGDVAGIYFSGVDDWEPMDNATRLQTLIGYFEFEKMMCASNSQANAA